MFCLICEDRVQQVLRDCCLGCKLQDVTVPLDDPLAIEALASDRDRSSKLILSSRMERLIARALTICVLSRRRVKLDEEERFAALDFFRVQLSSHSGHSSQCPVRLRV